VLQSCVVGQVVSGVAEESATLLLQLSTVCDGTCCYKHLINNYDIYRFLYVPAFVEAQESDFFQSVPEDSTLLAIVHRVHVFGKVRKVAFELPVLCFSDLIEVAGILEGWCLFARSHGAISYSNGQ